MGGQLGAHQITPSHSEGQGLEVGGGRASQGACHLDSLLHQSSAFGPLW